MIQDCSNHLTATSIEMQVKSVKIKAGKHTHNSCGIDGELFPLKGQVVSSLLPEQCTLIGRIPDRHNRIKSETTEGFELSELWQCFTEWSAYGAAVPIQLNNGDRVVQYYWPSLSALQLYTTKTVSSSTGSDHQIGDNCSDPTTDDDDSRDIQMTMDRCGYLYYQYNETTSPYNRVPFKEKISKLSKEYLGLVDLHSKDLSPYSWMAIAWYPVYQVPGATNVRELSACFLTYHPLSSLSLGSGNIKLGPEKVEGKRSSRVEEIRLPPFAMVTYKMFGTLWTSPGTSDSDTVLCRRNAASYWLEQLQFHHHDFNFFMSRWF
ncbi:uncharacterized protein LOC120209681 [Hibiscus syriacus]|uniref:uncharacterized protein LOC120209681 n=1 Tax=Hibiscus syriacus TaxID=106335 RepID=UPI001921397E|nr:uncharacterized protein LOC120209681 [Hibiscus syriacus]